MRNQTCTDQRIDRGNQLKRGLLIRTISIQLVDLSLSGCLLRSTDDMPVGANGELHVDMGGKKYCDAVYVTRSLQLQGSGDGHDVVGEFLWGSRPDGGTVRSKVRSIVPH